jgi:uncharacterized membrane protein YhaH (DUF805 family)
MTGHSPPWGRFWTGVTFVLAVMTVVYVAGLILVASRTTDVDSGSYGWRVTFMASGTILLVLLTLAALTVKAWVHYRAGHRLK